MEKFLDCFYVIIACYLFQKKHNLFYGLGVKDFLPMSAKYAHANKYFFGHRCALAVEYVVMMK